jgi:CRISP-associated protein Cas1
MIILDSELVCRFLELMERKFRIERPYRFKHGLKRADGLSKCQERTITKIAVQNFSNYCCRLTVPYLYLE